MKEIPEGFPRLKQPKKKTTRKFIKQMSDKRRAEIPERKEVIDATHERSGYKCEAGWIAPLIPCSRVLDTDEKNPRGTGGDYLDVEETATLCRKCHIVKGNEITVSEILGLYGPKRQGKHDVDEDLYEEAKRVFTKCKERLKIG